MEDGFRSMQEEAVRRVMEMQRRAQSYTSPPDTPDTPDEPASGVKLPADPLKELTGLDLDEEKALIGLLIYILYKNGADFKLLLGLRYLLF